MFYLLRGAFGEKGHFVMLPGKDPGVGSGSRNKMSHVPSCGVSVVPGQRSKQMEISAPKICHPRAK